MGRKRKELTEEEQMIYKKWFLAKPLLDKFLKGETARDRQSFMERVGIDHARLIALQTPGQMISSNYADKYAIRLGYHPCQIWPDWFEREPEGGSNPKMPKKKERQPSMAQDRIVYTDTQQL